MKTGILPDLDTEIDLDAEATCTLKFIVAQRPFCAQPAAWACQLACCGYVKVLCEAHRDPVTSLLPKIFICNRCRAKQPATSRAWRI